MNIPFSVLLLQGIPEQIVIALLAFSIAREPFKWTEAILLGTTLAIIAFLIRLLPITFGVHTIVLIGILFAYLNLLKKVDLTRAILSTLFSYLLLIVAESLTVPTIMNIFDISRENLLANNYLRIFITLPHVIVLFFLAFFLNKHRLNKKESSNVF